MPRPIVLDVDTGTDDALALLYAVGFDARIEVGQHRIHIGGAACERKRDARVTRVQTTYDDQVREQIPGARVGILQAKWYADETDSMVQRCKAILEAAGCTTVEVHRLPGSLELPIAAQVLLREGSGGYDALVCFGAIIRGETYHFDMVADECTRGLGEVSRNANVPIISEVLAVENLDQLRSRAGDDDGNKGIEAGLAAVEFIAWRRSLVTS